VTRFEQRVGGERFPGFRRSFDPQRILGNQVETERCEKGSELAELAAVAACEDYAHAD
jgi:hypothetical protein